MENFFTAVMLLLLGVLFSSLALTGAESVGVCYGRIGNDLPTEEDVVDFYITSGIKKMRLYDPNQATLMAAYARLSNLELILGVANQDIQALASDFSAAANWVQQNVLPYTPGVYFRYIAVGNEIKPTDAIAPFVLPAMQNIYNALESMAPALQINVSTAIDSSLLGSSFPPSAGAFSDSASSYIVPIVKFLAEKRAPLLANIYPYFAYIGDPMTIDINYALFTSPGVVVQDGPFGYQNVFDAMLDAYYSALEKVGAPDVEVVVSETGWPSDGGIAASVVYASAYYQNLISHVETSGTGSPRRAGWPIQAYLFAMFDENLKGPAETERHFGLFSPNKQPKYPIIFL
ncbi:Glycoside hydrolase, family 17 [Corchorus capsularis]|uniref:glucan endo-1,3-beta-D-glucosidase n=1 Tax=Corchorus capsularis TaxID=210143 RepID=A0A1R3I0N5_COCAP|nr:Glycoside hydrolase, family 17 [Corchorus capsularis]